MPVRASLILLAVLSLAVAAYALVVYTFLPLGRALHPDMRAAFEAHRVGIYTHVFASVVALALGPFQFWPGLRQRRPALHRWTGRAYLGVGVLVGGLAGLYMAQHAYGGWVSGLGFGTLAMAWLCSGLLAYRAIRAGDTAAHRRWMVRNFALSFAAVTLRLWLPASMLAGARFEVAYPLIAWACWVPNLLFAEWLLRRNRSNAAA